MANDSNKRKNRRRKGGVPTALVVILIAIAIVMGGLFGFVIARRVSPQSDQLDRANARIIELENTLNLIGFPLDGEAEAEGWVFDDAGTANAAMDLAGAPQPTAAEDVWGEDDSLLTGTLTDDGDPVVVAEYNGGQLLSTEVIPVFNDELTTQVFSGYSAEEVSDSVLQSVLSELTAQKLVDAKVRELGLDQIAEEEQRAIHQQAQQQYRDQISYYTAFVDREGLSGEEIEKAAEAYMNTEAKVTLESIEAELLAQLPRQKYYDYVVKDVEVTDQEVETTYQEMLQEQQSAYTQYPEEFEYAHTEGQTIVYNPEGYRAVLNLMLAFSSDEDAAQAEALMARLEQLDPMTQGDEMQAVDEALNPLFEPLEATANEIVEKLKNGEAFKDLLEQYGTDEMMNTEPLKSQGYYISDQSYLFSTEFIEGSMILETPGQVSAPLRSASGLHLAQYLRDVPAGPVALEQVYDQVRAEALKTRRDAAYASHIEELLEASDVQYYPERLQ